MFAAQEHFIWSDTLENAFTALQAALSTIDILGVPQSGENFHIFTDASNIAAGGAIVQSGSPLAFYSSKFSDAEQRYSTFDREALAVIKVFKNYRHWLIGLSK